MIHDRSKTGTRGRNNGYSMLEIVIVLLVATILMAMAVPQVKSSVNNYRLNSAVAMAKWAIQSTRFQALEKGYWYQVVFKASTMNYKIQSSTDNVTYTDVTDSGGTALPSTPLSSWPMTMSADTTINFKANGFVTVTVGSSPFSITYQGSCQQIGVSNYGNVSVSAGVVGTAPC